MSDTNIIPGIRKGSTISNTLSKFTNNATELPPTPRASVPQNSQDKPFTSLYERTMTLISKLYSLPDFEYYLFPEGIDALVGNGDSVPMIDPIAIIWRCFRLGAPLCHLLNQLQPKNLLSVPDLSGLVTQNVCKKCIFRFLIGVKEELHLADDECFTITEIYKDDTNDLVKVLGVVDKVVQEIERRGLFPRPKPFPFATKLETEDAKDNRSKSVAELLSTERSYIESLQELMQYQQDLLRSNVVTKDILHSIFSNLGELLDFQRRFLFSLETALAAPAPDQRIGAIFIQYETAFAVYHAMCANYASATQVAIQNQERLAGVGTIDPGRGLQGYLIKPVQRICRYPLLLKELRKLSTPENYNYCDELDDALEVMKRVTDRVNEVQRMEDNKALKTKLLEYVEDWQNLDPNALGDLLLYDKFNMVVQDIEQPHHIYLFENIILCCKENPTKKAKTVYDIKGQIYSTGITDVADISDPDSQLFEIKVFWTDRSDIEESFELKCRNIEQVALWKGRITLCMTGNTKNIISRPGSVNGNDEGRNSNSSRRNVQSVNANFLYDGGRRFSNDLGIEKNRISLPAKVVARTGTITKNGTEIQPRQSSMYSSKSRQGSESSRRSTNQRQPPSGTLPKPPNANAPPNIPLPTPTRVGPPTGALPTPPMSNNAPPTFKPAGGPPNAALPQPPTGALPQPPTSALPKPPSAALPQPPTSALPKPPSAALPQPPSSAMPKPPGAPLPQPPSAVLPKPPTSSLPQPPTSKPPTSSLPPPPTSSLPPPPAAALPPPPASSLPAPPTSSLPAPPASALPQPPSAALPTPPTSKLPSSGPPSSALPKPPSSGLPAPLSGPPNSSLPTPPRTNGLPVSSALRPAPPPSGPLPPPPTGSLPSTPRSPTPTGMSPSARAKSPSVNARNSPSLIKMKTHYGNEIFILAVPAKGCHFEEILDKIERKIRICGAPMPEGRRVKLRYKDEEGDFITINSDDDVEMAFEMAKKTSEKGTVTIMVQ
ncbi:hypothetical protein HDV04_000332 [Boothiomyces sp. JEL0838]|nr:hypothetical protein HDV04_000332 [Boothiomyces sp. JEL0838]